MSVNLSVEQKSIINIKDNGISLIKAYAGSGKTFTSKEFCKVNTDKKILYFFFNKSNRSEASRSFRDLLHVDVVTFHSLAYMHTPDIYKERLKIGELNAKDFAEFLRGTVSEESLLIYGQAVLTLMREFCASDLTIYDFITDIYSRAIEWSIKNGVTVVLILPIFKNIWETILSTHSYGFMHDIYLKLFQLSKPVLNYNSFVIDEAQDINPVMLDIVLHQSGQKLFIGDPYQSIYAWRGAINSLDWIEKNYKCGIYHLSRSFRCRENIANLANTIIKYQDNEAVEFTGSNNVHEPKHNKTAYIARTNGGIFNFCTENLDKKIHFVGGFDKYMFYDLLDIKYLMIKRKEFVRNSFFKNFEDIKSLANFAKETNNIGISGMISIVMNNSEKNFFELIKKIKACEIKSQEKADCIVCTAHRSKGLEWESVVLIDDFPFGKKKEKKAENIREEINLLYVAITRAKLNIDLPENINEFLMRIY